MEEAIAAFKLRVSSIPNRRAFPDVTRPTQLSQVRNPLHQADSLGVGLISAKCTLAS
jgi:hypothetical protein